jgi:hypothetical protein
VYSMPRIKLTKRAIDALPSPPTDVVYWDACPYRKPKQLTEARESVDSSIDERSLQADLVRLDRAVPAARCVGSDCDYIPPGRHSTLVPFGQRQ